MGGGKRCQACSFSESTGSAIRDRLGDRAVSHLLERTTFILNKCLPETRPKHSVRSGGVGIHGAANRKRQMFFLVFPLFEDSEPNYGWGAGPETEATHWTVLDRRSRNEFSTRGI